LPVTGLRGPWYLARGGDLVGRQADAVGGAGALHRSRIPVTGARVGQERIAGDAAALDSALMGARRRHRAGLAGAEEQRQRCLVRPLVAPQRGGVIVGAVVRRVADEDAVVVGRIALCRHVALLATGRAAGEVGIGRRG